MKGLLRGKGCVLCVELGLCGGRANAGHEGTTLLLGGASPALDSHYLGFKE